MQVKTFALVGAAIFCAANLICPQNAFAEKKGQDFPDQKCQRNNKDGSITTGQCSSVCKDLDVSTTKDVDTGYRTCKEARTIGGWGVVSLTHPSVQLLRYNDSGEVQACSLTSRGDEMVCHPVTIKQGQAKTGQ